VAELEENLASGWEYTADVTVELPFERARGCLPRALGRLERTGSSCRLTGTTSNPWWYAQQLVGLPGPYRINGGPELRHCARVLAERLLTASADAQRA
jgi:hypothetical protein